MVALEYQGFPIEYNAATRLICLNDLWRAQCSLASKRPLAWVRVAATQKLLKKVSNRTAIEPQWSQQQQPGTTAEKLIVRIPGNLETFEIDNNFRTYATTELAVVYARFLASECYEWALVNLAENLAEGEVLADNWVSQQLAMQQQEQQKVFSRRTVIAAGLSIPVITTLLGNQQTPNQKTHKQASSSHSDTPNVHNDTTHTDGANVSHTDGNAVTHIDGDTVTSHVDSGVGHGDGSGRGHIDVHSDGHTDRHTDNHFDT
jgi:KilA-N domain